MLPLKNQKDNRVKSGKQKAERLRCGLAETGLS